MREHLRDSVSYYFLDPEDKRPTKAISEIDGQIIEGIIGCLNRLGQITLAEILSRWKRDSDQDVLDAVLFYAQSQQLEEDRNEKDRDFWKELEDRMKASFITIQDETLLVHKIISIKRMTIHDKRPYYTLLINREDDMPPQYRWYVDKEFRWGTREARDAFYEELKAHMVNNTVCKFLN